MFVSVCQPCLGALDVPSGEQAVVNNCRLGKKSPGGFMDGPSVHAIED